MIDIRTETQTFSNIFVQMAVEEDTPGASHFKVPPVVYLHIVMAGVSPTFKSL